MIADRLGAEVARGGSPGIPLMRMPCDPRWQGKQVVGLE